MTANPGLFLWFRNAAKKTDLRNNLKAIGVVLSNIRNSYIPENLTPVNNFNNYPGYWLKLTFGLIRIPRLFRKLLITLHALSETFSNPVSQSTRSTMISPFPAGIFAMTAGSVSALKPLPTRQNAATGAISSPNRLV